MDTVGSRVSVSVAADAGGIELLHACFDGPGVPPHIHDEYSISIPLRGGLGFDFRGSRHLAPSRVISCVGPGEVHNAFAAEGREWEFISFLVPGAAVRQVVRGLDAGDELPDLPGRVVMDQPLAERFVALFGLLKNAGGLLERQSTCTLVLAEFFGKYSTAGAKSGTDRPEHRAVQRAREFLHACSSQPISLARLAESAGLSTCHFLRTFRAAVGITPHMYLNQIRVLQAKRRLSDGATPAEAALACGFCDQSHMSRQFKRVALTTPGQYRGAFISKGRSH